MASGGYVGQAPWAARVTHKNLAPNHHGSGASKIQFSFAPGREAQRTGVTVAAYGGLLRDRLSRLKTLAKRGLSFNYPEV